MLQKFYIQAFKTDTLLVIRFALQNTNYHYKNMKILNWSKISNIKSNELYFGPVD